MEAVGTKEKVVDAAVSLFNTKGYHGTSVREIAKKAGVNVALISYYFKGKQGLLEHLMSSFFEGYIEKLEQACLKIHTLTVRECMLNAIVDLLSYQHEHNRLARIVHRETTIDTVLIREIMTIYLRKENYYWQKLLEYGFKKGEFKRRAIDLAVMQLKGMITMPFIHPQYLQEILQLSPSDNHFIKRYAKFMSHWVDQHLCQTEISENKTAQVYSFTAVP